jgi:hypothetical protein
VNDARRKEIEQAISQIEEAKSILETAASDEREEFDELPEKTQESEKGIKIEAVATALEESLDDCDSLVSKLQDAKV